MDTNILSRVQKQFIFLGFINLLAAMLTPFFFQNAIVIHVIVVIHKVGIFQGLLYFAFAYLWTYCQFNKPLKYLTVFTVNASFLANIIGSELSAFLGTGGSEFISPSVIKQFPSNVNETLNTITLFLLNASEYIIPAILLFISGLFLKKYQTLQIILHYMLFIIFSAFIVLQTFYPNLSNSFF